MRHSTFILPMGVASLVLALLLAGKVSVAQPATPQPVPPQWAAAGVTAYPAYSPQLSLDFADIVLPGTVKVRMFSKLQFTQKLVLFASAPGAPDTMTQLTSVALTSRTPQLQSFSYPAKTTQNITLLAQTPEGWFMVERQLKVGHQP